jgi:RND superfamily putative drug exporter
VNSTQQLARLSSRHPWRTLGIWGVALVAGVAAVVVFLGSALTTDSDVTNNPESIQAENLLVERGYFERDYVDEVVIVRNEQLTIDDAAFRRFVEDVYAQGRATGAVARATSFYDSRDRSLVSADRHATLLPIVMGDDPEERIEDVIRVVEERDGDQGFAVSISGTYTLDHDFNELSQRDLKEGELYFGAPAALIILVLVFGAIVAALMPLAMALISIAIALGLVAIIGQAFEFSFFVFNMLSGMGLALGIDYSLFVVSRYREERARGREQLDAIAVAGSTASRAVLFSGIAFVLAMFGLLLVPDTIFRSLAGGAILVGIVAVLAALTLLPALLGLVGDRVNALRVPVIGRSAEAGTGTEGRFWSAVTRMVMRRPVVSLVLSAGLLLAASAPVLDLETGFPGVSTLPDDFVSKKGFLALERDFRAGLVEPTLIVIDGESSPEVRAAVNRLEQRLAANDDFGPPSVQSEGETLVVSVPVSGDPDNPQAVEAVRDLRSEVIPDAFAGVEAPVLVGGDTAESVDYFDLIATWLPIVFAFVLGLSFILLTIAFRSIVLPLKAIVLNLLSVGAAYGLIVLVFVKGFGNELLGLRQVDTVTAWVPLFLFAVLFGLSMDYHVFLLSRIRERFLQTGDNEDAVAHSVASTARLITGAALIIVAVFWGFAMGDMVMFQQMGFGIAVALVIDATIIRSVLVPASMKLLGRWNWYLPSWLEWLPEFHIEGAEAPRERRDARPAAAH